MTSARVAAIALLVGEYLLLSFAVDAQDLPFLHHTPSTAGYVGAIGPLVACIVTALFLLGDDSFRSILASAGGEAPWWRRRAPLVAHLVTYGAFFTSTIVYTLGAVPARGSLSAIAPFAWAALGIATFATWCAVAIPRSLWRWAATHGARVLVVSMLVGVAALGFGFLAERYWPLLARGTMWLSSLLLAMGPGHVSFDATTFVIRLDHFAVEISAECSGAEGMGLMAVLVPAYLFAFRRELRFPHALVLIPAGIIAAYLANALRIAALVWVGRYVSAAMAVSGFHSKAGWLAFCAIALVLVLVSRRSLSREDVTSTPLVDGPLESYLGPELALLATTLITGLFAVGVDRWYGLRLVAAGAVLFVGRRAWIAKYVPSLLPFVVGIATYGAWVALTPWSHGAPALEAFLASRGSVERILWIAVRVLGSVAVVPLVEELAFRGFLMRWATARSFADVDPRTSRFRGLLLSSLVFGALHSHVLAATVAGFAYGALYRFRGRLGDAVVAHATTNALIAVEVLVLGHFDRW